MKNIILGLLLIPIIWGCSVEDEKIRTQQKVIDNLEAHVILPTYEMLYERVLDLQFSVERVDVADADALLQAREAWLDAREIWEQSESYIINDDSIGYIKQQLDRFTLTKNVKEQHQIANGAFQRLEQLLWGDHGNQEALHLSAAEILSMNDAALDIAVSTQKLLAFITQEFQHKSVHIDRDKKEKLKYCQQRMKLYIDNMIHLTSDIIERKIDIPFNDSNMVALERHIESVYSDNGKFDILNNIVGLEQLYLGGVDHKSTSGLADMVRLKDVTLDEKIRGAIADSKRAISGLPESYAMALSHDRDAVVVAKYKLKVVQELLHSELLPIVQSL